MQRKAQIAKNSPVTVEIMENYLEPYFSSIKADFEAVDKKFKEVDKRFEAVDQRFVSLREYMDQRFEKQDGILQTILQIVQHIDAERKDIKSFLWEHENRLLKLEKHFA